LSIPIDDFSDHIPRYQEKSFFPVETEPPLWYVQKAVQPFAECGFSPPGGMDRIVEMS
jgi:hypothetical protein